ncbi:hypothetical protein FHETE_11140 [Fusarium heterosporum]|uniref:Uncharacterized protein n=1 Tax=Fusarium heterosporum TaxID=42747 RepID=A0A8H5SRY8_FUSHE|nr:hypothetical protein FHETE_11140 [Fusarium heterosporum]
MSSLKNIFSKKQGPGQASQAPESTWTVADYRERCELLEVQLENQRKEIAALRTQAMNAEHEAHSTRRMLKRARDAFFTASSELDNNFRLSPAKKAVDDAIQNYHSDMHKAEAYKQIKKLKEIVDGATIRLKSFANELDAFLK